jgi:nucleotide-binding universal stress UspA family protein
MKEAEKGRHVLIATDGSPGAQAAVEEGVRIAKLTGAGVLFLAVAYPPLRMLGEPFYQRALTAQLAARRKALAMAVPFANERRVRYETELMEGSPAQTILELARNRDVDLIVVGSRGLGSVKGTLLGSVSSEVVHHADRPVLVARPPDRAARNRLARIAV